MKMDTCVDYYYPPRHKPFTLPFELGTWNWPPLRIRPKPYSDTIKIILILIMIPLRIVRHHHPPFLPCNYGCNGGGMPWRWSFRIRRHHRHHHHHLQQQQQRRIVLYHHHHHHRRLLHFRSNRRHRTGRIRSYGVCTGP